MKQDQELTGLIIFAILSFNSKVSLFSQKLMTITAGYLFKLSRLSYKRRILR